MRHLGSLLLSLVLAPAVWVLAGYGMNEVSIGVGRFDLRLVGGYAALAAAGVLLTLLVLTRLSPVGPATAGLAFIVVSVWAGQDPGLFRDLFTASVFGRPAGLVNPIVAIGPVVGTLLLLTVTSPRRWQRHPATAAPQPIYPGATVGPPPGFPPPYPTSPAFAAAPGSPAGPYATGVLYGQGYGAPAGPPAPTSAAPASGPPGPVPPPPMAQSGPLPAAAPVPTGAGSWSTPPPPAPDTERTPSPPRPPATERTPPPPPPRFTPHVPRQPGASEAADATDATTRLGPSTGATDATTRLSPPPPADETTRLTPRQDTPSADESDQDEQTTLLRPPAPAGDGPEPDGEEKTTLLTPPAAGGDPDGDETTVLGSRAKDAEEPTERVADDGGTRPLHGTPPPPAAYPPPGHATPTAPPTDPDATRRL